METSIVMQSFNCLFLVDCFFNALCMVPQILWNLYSFSVFVAILGAWYLKYWRYLICYVLFSPIQFASYGIFIYESYNFAFGNSNYEVNMREQLPETSCFRKKFYFEQQTTYSQTFLFCSYFDNAFWYYSILYYLFFILLYFSS